MSWDIVNNDIQTYCERYVSAEDDLLKDLARETHVKIMSPRMLSGNFQGQVLTFISKLVRPNFILEIGTYTGYSAICLAKGLAAQGKLISIDINEETAWIAEKYVRASGLPIELVCDNALQVIPDLPKGMDLVFIDADKENYAAYYDLVLDKLNPGGIILADNVLWSGKILMPEEKMDKDTRALHAFNQKVAADPRVEKFILPIRDGIHVIRKC